MIQQENVIGVMIRKKGNWKGIMTNPSYTVLEKEMLTTHKKGKKKDKSIITTYSLERDPFNKKSYHIHCIIHYSNKETLKEVFQNYIGGENWKTTIRDFIPIEYCSGKWGEVVLHEIYDEKNFTGYMSKMNCGIVKQLV